MSIYQRDVQGYSLTKDKERVWVAGTQDDFLTLTGHSGSIPQTLGEFMGYEPFCFRTMPLCVAIYDGVIAKVIS